MNIDGLPYRTIWPAEEGVAVEIIDQTRLPHEFATVRLENLHDAAIAIKNMLVRGAPLIGATAAYGVALAMSDKASDTALEEACSTLAATRPTAINLRWALARMKVLLLTLPPERRAQAAWLEAAAICDEDVDNNRALGQHGLKLIRDRLEAKGEPVNILTHCNAGWLATVDWGTALAPIYTAFDAGIPLHVWVDETRPRNQGASLTAWELQQHGVPHTVIADNTGGHLMQHGMVDMVIVGTDRTTACGDVCNKIGTYLKALAAFDNQIPFYVALPGPTIDWTLEDGVREIPIEQRDAEEVTQIRGRTAEGEIVSVTLTPHGSPAANYAFDVTPARLVTGLITERGVCPASRDGLLGLYPEHSSASLTAREAESRTVSEAELPVVSEAELRRALIDTAMAAQREGLNRGASGNLSVRCGDGFLITPSGMAPGEQTPEDVAWMDFDGNARGRRKPSSEWRFHRDLYIARPEFGAVLHAHSTFATTLACLGRDIPPFHYMIAAAGGKTIRCAPYATFGTQELSEHALAAMNDRKACLLGNHGLLVAETDLPRALAVAVEVESLCEQYCRLLQIGTPNLLSDTEMDVVLEKFKTYGQNAQKT